MTPPTGSAPRVLVACAMVAVLAACGGGGGGASPAGGSTGRPTAPALTDDPAASDDPSGSSPSAPAPAAGSGATIRVVNVWTEPDGPGPTVALRERGAEGAAPLLTVPSGSVTDFVTIPKAQYGDRPINLEVAVEGDPSVTALGVSSGESDPGDRITVVVHGEAQGDATVLRVEPVWEAGEPAAGSSWPEVDPAAATLAVIAGPLLVHGFATTLNLRTADGACLIDPQFGDPQEHAFGGTGVHHLELDAGHTDLLVGSEGAAGCGPIEPDVGEVGIDAVAGQHLALIPWGPKGALDVLLLDMGTGT